MTRLWITLASGDELDLIVSKWWINDNRVLVYKKPRESAEDKQVLRTVAFNSDAWLVVESAEVIDEKD